MNYLYNSKYFNPYYNLAVEDYFLDFANRSKNIFILYFWQNDNTVVIGRNQDAFSECNIDNLLLNKAFLARRKTGGGAVFHDKNNLNFSFIVPKDKFDKKISMDIIKTALLSLGLKASVSGRNDVLVDGCKCSGNAYLNKNNTVLHHGTILVNTDVNLMQKLLNVNEEKLKSKGVKSVKSRVINLQSVDNLIDAEMIKSALKESFENTYKIRLENYVPDEDEIWEKEKFYSDDLWIYGDKKFAKVKSVDKKFDWGMCSIKILKSGEKQFVKIYSDSLDYELIEKAEFLINTKQSDISDNRTNKTIIQIFEFYNQILSLQ